MAQVAPDKLKPEEKDRLVCTYAALLLHDDGLEISVSNAISYNQFERLKAYQSFYFLALMYFRKRNLARSSRLAETPLRATGQAFSPRHSRVKTLPSCSQMLALVAAVVAVAPLLLAAVTQEPLLRRNQPRRKKRKRQTSTWEISSVAVMTTTEEEEDAAAATAVGDS